MSLAREGDAEQSFLFLRNELPVRLASMMKEMGHLPERLFEMPSVKVVNGWYGASLTDLHSFKSSPPSSEVVKRFDFLLISFLKFRSFLNLVSLKFYKIFANAIQL